VALGRHSSAGAEKLRVSGRRGWLVLPAENAGLRNIGSDGESRIAGDVRRRSDHHDMGSSHGEPIDGGEWQPILPHELPVLRVVYAEEQPVAAGRVDSPSYDEDAIGVQHDSRRRVVASGDIDEILPEESASSCVIGTYDEVIVARRVLGAADCDDPTMSRRDGPSDVFTASEIKMILPEEPPAGRIRRGAGKEKHCACEQDQGEELEHDGYLPCPGSVG
jgi:hypothetical protein